jgi:hypothetical protein
VDADEEEEEEEEEARLASLSASEIAKEKKEKRELMTEEHFTADKTTSAQVDVNRQQLQCSRCNNNQTNKRIATTF